MVEMKTVYQGELRCSATHGPSGATIVTDAPADNFGKGQAFSPTDLVATALATCMLTTMGIVARRSEIDLTGTTATVTKEMVTQPTRRIGRLAVTITGPAKLTTEQRQLMENTARACPVHRSLHPDVQLPIEIRWTNA